MNRIIICDQDFSIDCPTITWKDPGGMNAYSYKKFNYRTLNLDQLKQQTSCFVLHHSVTYTARSCYDVLVNRGLSCTFLIDDDNKDGYATLYQTLDVKEVAWSHGPLNSNGAGVEICYMPQAWENPNLYSETNRKKYKVPEHQIVEDTIQGRKIKVFAPTQAQINTVECLTYTICTALDLPASFPRDSQGLITKSALDNPKSHNGLLGHFNITVQKNDPAGIDLYSIEKNVELKQNKSPTISAIDQVLSEFTETFK
jgi:hypothetical protein